MRRQSTALFLLALAGTAAALLIWPSAQEGGPRVSPPRVNDSSRAKSEEEESSPVRAGQPPAANTASESDAPSATPTPLPTPSDDAPLAPRRRDPLPKLGSGRIDFAALGLTGKEVGAELLRSEETTHSAAIQFHWNAGDEWTVESYYRQMQAGDGEVWAGPTRWRFRVEREELCQGVPCQVIEATMLGEDGAPSQTFPPCVFYVSSEDRRLVAADLYTVRAGRGKFTRVRGDAGAIGVTGSIVPFDLPARGSEGKRVGGDELPNLDLAATSAGSRRQFPRPGEILGAGEDYLEVAYASPSDGTRITQRWAVGDSLWPAVSISHHRRSYRRR